MVGTFQWFALASLMALVAQVAPPAPSNLRILTGVAPSPGRLPPGVTLRPIDGGPTYYADHGFTYAVNRGWDNPAFFPIGLWLAPMHSQADANRWLDLNLNTAFTITANSNLALLRANGLSAVIQSDELSQILSANGGALDAETVGLMTWDEPSTHEQAT